jgi:protein-L-isoaspartate(D-aspartate) O-methyltransferase
VIDYTETRRRMVKEQIEVRGVSDQRVLKAMEKVPRHLFVPGALLDQAYDDSPLTIGHKQTISQPYTVAFMTEALELKGGERVLEVGTGSGYQCAVLAELAREVFSIERIPELAELARLRLKEMGYKNVHIVVGDGTLGLKDHAPFDAIIVTASGPELPATFIEQLAEGGRLVIPVGERSSQNMYRVRKHHGEVVKDYLGPFRFVELVGRFGYQE